MRPSNKKQKLIEENEKTIERIEILNEKKQRPCGESKKSRQEFHPMKSIIDAHGIMMVQLAQRECILNLKINHNLSHLRIK